MIRKTTEKPPNAYHAHRERQRRRILDAAWALFNDRGIDRLTMAEITARSGVQPSTIYQYFSNKDDIVWSLLNELMEEASERAKQAIEGASNALASITALLDFLADDLLKNPVKVRFMAQFDAIYARDWPVERLISIETRINPKGFGVLTDLVREGIADGSLRGDLDPDLTLHAVINVVIGAQRRLASLGKKIEREYGKPIDRLFRESLRVILLGLRAPEPQSRLPRKKQRGRNRNLRKRSS